MAKTFTYRAKDPSGQVFSGTLVADSEAAVASYIRAKGQFVTQIRESRRHAWKALLNLTQKVRLKDLAVFCRQFATMVDAGLSLIVCLNILTEQTQNPLLKETLRAVGRKIQEGETLSQAMRDYPHIFPELMVSMMEAAEVGGVLDVVLNRLAVQFEKEYKMDEKVRSAMVYPLVVIGFAALVVIFILTFVLPIFVQQFAAMKLELPVPTRILLAISGFLRDFGLLFAIGLIALGYGLRLYARRPAVRQVLDRLTLRLPVFGTLWRMVAVARFTRTLGTLLRGGVPILTALEAVKRTTNNQMIIQALTAAQGGVREGMGLGSTLGSSRLFPPMVIQMVAVGEEAGELDKMLDKVADFYESDIDDMVGRLSSLLEPALILVLGGVIGFIVISIMMPYFDFISNASKI